jgi:hypothetical protein
MHKIVIAATFSSSLAYANDIVVLGSPMDVVQKPATLEALSREVAGINPAVKKSFAASPSVITGGAITEEADAAFELGSFHLAWLGPDGDPFDDIALKGLITAGIGEDTLAVSSDPWLVSPPAR